MEWKKYKMNLNHDIGIRCDGSWSCFILYLLLLSLTFTTFTYFHSHLFYLQTESFSHLNWKITSTKAFDVLVVSLAFILSLSLSLLLSLFGKLPLQRRLMCWQLVLLSFLCRLRSIVQYLRKFFKSMSVFHQKPPNSFSPVFSINKFETFYSFFVVAKFNLERVLCLSSTLAVVPGIVPPIPVS